jgi:hypothetical protein
MLEVEAVPQSSIPLSPDWFEYGFIHEKSVACGESWITSILAKVIRNCFRFVRKCVCVR